MALLIITITIILFFAILIIWRTVSSIRNRKTPIPEGYKIIQLQGLTISWGQSFFWLAFFILLIVSDTGFYEGLGNLLHYIFFGEVLLVIAIDFSLQKFFKPDRIIYGNQEIIYLGEWKRTIKVNSITEISLNGINDKISIRGNSYFSFKRSLITKIELEELFDFIDEKKGFDDIEVTDNLKYKRFSEVKFPTIAWEKAMNEDFKIGELHLKEKYSKEIFDQVDIALSYFVSKMKQVDGSQFPEKVKAEVKTLVDELNKLGGFNGKFGNFIETGEREDLCNFIDRVILLTGYRLREFEDLTEEDREW